MLFALAGLVRPTSGSVHVCGSDLGALSDTEAAALRAARIGMVFQFFHLLPALSALDNVMIPLRLAGVPSAEARARASDLLESIGLGSRRQHRPHELSGGEQQRVAVARAIIADPLIVLADEPTGNLDAESATVVASLLDKVTRGQRTVVVASHDERILAGMDRTLVLHLGKLREPAAGGVLESGGDLSEPRGPA
jgi:putative ABC transport system ATP-binding protein